MLFERGDSELISEDNLNKKDFELKKVQSENPGTLTPLENSKENNI